MRVAHQSDPFERLDSFVETIARAHMAIFALHRELIAQDVADAESQALLDESVTMALRQARQATLPARRLDQEQGLRAMVGETPTAAESKELKRELEAVEAQLAGYLRRQEQIAAALRARLDSPAR